MQVKLPNGSESQMSCCETSLCIRKRAFENAKPFPIPNVKGRNLNKIRYEIEQFQYSGRKLVPE